MNKPDTYTTTRDPGRNCYTCDSCQYRFYEGGEGITCLTYKFFFPVQTFPSTRGNVCKSWHKKKKRH